MQPSGLTYGEWGNCITSGVGQSRKFKQRDGSKVKSKRNFKVSSAEVTAQLLQKRRNAEADLTEESVKCHKQLEPENTDLRKTVHKQGKTIVGLKSGTMDWSEHFRQQSTIL